MSTKIKRMMAAVALAGAASSAVAFAATVPASAAPRHLDGPQPVTTRLAPVKAGTTSWVNIVWRTDSPVCDAKVQVDGGHQVTVSYPGMRRTTTFTHGDTLRPGRTAATPIRVNPGRHDGVVPLRAVMSYNDCGRHSRTEFTRVNLALPVLRAGLPHQKPTHGVGHH